MITLKVFNSSLEAHILKSKLESEGIECVLFDENTMDMNPLYNYTIGGVKLKIDEKDLDKATKILQEIERTPYENRENEPIKCPKCNSANLENNFLSHKGFYAALVFFASAILAVFPLSSRKDYFCKNCGNVFGNID